LSNSLLNNKRKILSFLKSLACNQIKPIDTISIIGHQLHDDILQKSFIDSFVLAKAFMQESATNSLEHYRPNKEPLAEEWVCHPVYASIIRDCYTNNNNGVVYLPQNRKYFLETCWGWGKHRTRVLSGFNSGKKITVESENPIFVFSGTGYHGIVEDLAISLTLLDHGIVFDIVLDSSDKWMKGLVDLFLPNNIGRIYLKKGYWINAYETIAVTKSSFGEYVNPTLIKKLADAARNITNKGPKEKLFISRSDSSKRSNSSENTLEKNYISKGYRPVVLSNLSVIEQVSLFRQASAVAGMHGAGFVNLVWSEPGVEVEEFYLSSHFNACYHSICEYVGHNYSSICVDE